ncbi:DUF6493 family protein [Corynebacterium mendelii]|uniref:DUF6493 domain-containing protein n=1 Tax=Corynebacterium mendelii TaxID=2765362 RepID=A0A939E1S6_9CORY|nr:DUF6493 family protein [Corynebacterium mendelii]MBN9644865.1 hypothetical protein [Corynebacterium mendelii]
MAKLLADKPAATLEDFYRVLMDHELPDSRWAQSPQEMMKLATTATWTGAFLRLRLGELLFGWDIDHDDDYVLGLVNIAVYHDNSDIRRRWLAWDEQLRETTFWRLFEVEGGGEISMANLDKFGRVHTWVDDICWLSEKGYIDRQRVLRASLEALNRDFSSYRAGFYARLFKAMDPTPEEAAEIQDLLRLTLASPVTSSVSLAVGQCKKLHKHGLLDEDEFVLACEPALATTKTNAVAVLAIATGIHTNGRADAAALKSLLEAALYHQHPDVQKKALSLLASLGTGIDRSLLSSVSPMVLDELGLDVPGQPEETGAAHDAGAADGVLEPVTAESVTPVTDADALQRISVALETTCADPIELEMILAWLARADKPADILAPLKKRASQLSGRTDNYLVDLIHLVVTDDHDFLPQREIHTYSTSDTTEVVTEVRPGTTAEEETPLPALVTRLRDVAAILTGDQPQRELLSTPTDTTGSLDPDEVIARHTRNTQAGARSSTVDINQALWRVEADDRQRLAQALGVHPPTDPGQIVLVWEGPKKWPTATGFQPSDLDEIRINPAGLRESISHWDDSRPHLVGQMGIARRDNLDVLVVNTMIGMWWADSDVYHDAGAVLDAIDIHPAKWTPATAQLVYLAFGNKNIEIRARVAELVATHLPRKMDAVAFGRAITGAQQSVIPTRAADVLRDIAVLNRELALELMPEILLAHDRKRRGIARVMEVYLDEALRQKPPAPREEFLSWLDGFTGSSKAAKAARAIVKMHSGG